MKKLLNNQKGSVLSSAIIIIALLSLTLTTVTAQTSNIASRTNATVSRDDETVFAQTMIQSSLQDIRMFILDKEFESFDEFGPLEDEDGELNNIIETYNTLIREYYETNAISYNGNPNFFEENPDFEPFDVIVSSGGHSTDSESSTRVYTATFRQSNGQTISKRLNIELTTDTTDGQNGSEPVDINSIDDIFTHIFDVYINPDNEDVQELDEETFENNYNPNQGQDGEIESNVFFEGNPSMTRNSGQGRNRLGFVNSSRMFVEGNLTIENFSEIAGPGLIVVSGDLTITDRDFIDMNQGSGGPLYFIVGGGVDIEIDGRDQSSGALNGENYHIISRQRSTLSLNESGSNFTRLDFPNDEPPFYYLGSDGNFSGFDQFIDDFDDLFESGVGFSGVFNYFESSFETE